MNDAVCGGEVGLNYCGVNAASLDGNGPVGARCYHVEVEVVAGVKSVYLGKSRVIRFTNLYCLLCLHYCVTIGLKVRRTVESEATISFAQFFLR